MYAVRIENNGVFSEPVMVNKARVNQMEFPEVSPGHAFRLFGRNLSINGNTPTVQFIDGGTTLSATVNTAESDEYILFNDYGVCSANARPIQDFSFRVTLDANEWGNGTILEDGNRILVQNSTIKNPRIDQYALRFSQPGAATIFSTYSILRGTIFPILSLWTVLRFPGFHSRSFQDVLRACLSR
ncbi:MAG: hypothetical protein L0Y32_00155 [Nevskiales bacterium]|nr:hypothetical protein [Nevskiales bacterium]